jgi:hypothetical protein
MKKHVMCAVPGLAAGTHIYINNDNVHRTNVLMNYLLLWDFHQLQLKHL